ncbi:hypothetical protein CHELA1G11_20877 [Hyphomicrobiales bacterium]|nr:hypothetical protein CHELA1G11_20877 [Hyphomicrobiales bacterium]CAH1692391.1 hypothetical protein CHELA1G2_21194 [Hyphomicrobiales bacterium]
MRIALQIPLAISWSSHSRWAVGVRAVRSVREIVIYVTCQLVRRLPKGLASYLGVT